ncbi:NfeD family protein [Paucibacter sp. APW11]|uniref:NfeD family protein n=1 Tax=Roseateles aquae TaxID=3077235 RepID=A0ABU3P6R8_9BURK|nr:NfeD family protein [Paucibacter sp. APW11]MDT8997920.1 NfeD family protein [Paucibacter sp. APW11]
MGWGLSTLWWMGCGALVAAELLSGTFYLLMLALGAAAGALAAHLGLSFSLQMLLAALVGGCATSLWHLKRIKTLRAQPPAQANPDVNLDIGQIVSVDTWSADGTARVLYRGAQWNVRFTGEDSPAPGRHIIRAVEGSCLLLAPV